MTCLIPKFPLLQDITIGFGHIQLPSLPMLPTPFFGSFKCPSIETPHWAVELQNLFYGGITVGILQKICSLIGLSFTSLLPSIPGLPNINIMHFITGEYTKIKNAIILAGDKLNWIFPTNIFKNIHAPNMEIAHKIQMLFSSAIKSIVDLIISKSTDVINFIRDTFHVGISGLSFPLFPSFSSIELAIVNALKGVHLPTIPNFHILTFTGFPPISIPSFGSINAPNIQTVKLLPVVIMALIAVMMDKIKIFIDDISSFIGGFTWPKCCVDNKGPYLG